MSEEKILSFDSDELQKYEPNRYPFLYIDRVTECVPGKYAKGYKNLTNNEWFFPIHYPGKPLVPGAVQMEALCQMLTIALNTMDGVEDINIEGVECKVKFIKKIRPGDRLDIVAEVKSYTRGIGKGVSRGYVDGELACEAEVTLLLPSVFYKYRPKRVEKNAER